MYSSCSWTHLFLERMPFGASGIEVKEGVSNPLIRPGHYIGGGAGLNLPAKPQPHCRSIHCAQFLRLDSSYQQSYKSYYAFFAAFGILQGLCLGSSVDGMISDNAVERHSWNVRALHCIMYKPLCPHSLCWTAAASKGTYPMVESHHI